MVGIDQPPLTHSLQRHKFREICTAFEVLGGDGGHMADLIFDALTDRHADTPSSSEAAAGAAAEQDHLRLLEYDDFKKFVGGIEKCLQPKDSWEVVRYALDPKDWPAEDELLVRVEEFVQSKADLPLSNGTLYLTQDLLVHQAWSLDVIHLIPLASIAAVKESESSVALLSLADSIDLLDCDVWMVRVALPTPKTPSSPGRKDGDAQGLPADAVGEGPVAAAGEAEGARAKLAVGDSDRVKHVKMNYRLSFSVMKDVFLSTTGQEREQGGRRRLWFELLTELVAAHQLKSQDKDAALPVVAATNLVRSRALYKVAGKRLDGFRLCTAAQQGNAAAQDALDKILASREKRSLEGAPEGLGGAAQRLDNYFQQPAPPEVMGGIRGRSMEFNDLGATTLLHRERGLSVGEDSQPAPPLPLVSSQSPSPPTLPALSAEDHRPGTSTGIWRYHFGALCLLVLAAGLAPSRTLPETGSTEPDCSSLSLGLHRFTFPRSSQGETTLPLVVLLLLMLRALWSPSIREFGAQAVSTILAPLDDAFGAPRPASNGPIPLSLRMSFTVNRLNWPLHQGTQTDERLRGGV